MCGCDPDNDTKKRALGYINLGQLPCGHTNWMEPPKDEVITLWGSCGACDETWTVDSLPPWFSARDALKELERALADHQFDCPVRTRPNGRGIL